MKARPPSALCVAAVLALYLGEQTHSLPELTFCFCRNGSNSEGFLEIDRRAEERKRDERRVRRVEESASEDRLERKEITAPRGRESLGSDDSRSRSPVNSYGSDASSFPSFAPTPSEPPSAVPTASNPVDRDVPNPRPIGDQISSRPRSRSPTSRSRDRQLARDGPHRRSRSMEGKRNKDRRGKEEEGEEVADGMVRRSSLSRQQDERAYSPSRSLSQMQRDEEDGRRRHGSRSRGSLSPAQSVSRSPRDSLTPRARRHSLSHSRSVSRSPSRNRDESLSRSQQRRRSTSPPNPTKKQPAAPRRSSSASPPRRRRKSEEILLRRSSGSGGSSPNIRKNPPPKLSIVRNTLNTNTLNTHTQHSHAADTQTHHRDHRDTTQTQRHTITQTQTHTIACHPCFSFLQFFRKM